MSKHPPVKDFATDFDHTDPKWVANPFPICDALREDSPVAHTDRYGGAWLPVTHEGVAAIAYDTEHFTSRDVVMHEGRPGENDLPAPIGVAPPITSDPPFHALARRILLPAFAPKPITALEPFTRELCNELLDALEGKDVVDAALEYAQHIPVGVIVRMLDAGDYPGGARQFVETIAYGPGAWERLSPELRETFVFNASTWRDEARDPEALSINLDRLRPFSAPALLTLGGQSPPFFPLVVRQIAQRIPQAVTRTFPGAGHVPHLSHPDEYVATVTSFADEAAIVRGRREVL